MLLAPRPKGILWLNLLLWFWLSLIMYQAPSVVSEESRVPASKCVQPMLTNLPICCQLCQWWCSSCRCYSRWWMACYSRWWHASLDAAANATSALLQSVAAYITAAIAAAVATIAVLLNYRHHNIMYTYCIHPQAIWILVYSSVDISVYCLSMECQLVFLGNFSLCMIDDLITACQLGSFKREFVPTCL